MPRGISEERRGRKKRIVVAAAWNGQPAGFFFFLVERWSRRGGLGTNDNGGAIHRDKDIPMSKALFLRALFRAPARSAAAALSHRTTAVGKWWLKQDEDWLLVSFFFPCYLNVTWLCRFLLANLPREFTIGKTRLSRFSFIYLVRSGPIVYHQQPTQVLGRAEVATTSLCLSSCA